MIKQIKKRNNEIVDFNQDKIVEAIYKATQSVNKPELNLAKELSDRVVDYLELMEERIPNIETIQDIIEKVLIEEGQVQIAKSFILYRQKRKEIREAESLIGVVDDCDLGLNALKILESRYLLKNDGVTETPRQMFERVANNIAQIEQKYGNNVEDMKKEFFDHLINKLFLPNSPTLMNAGTKVQQLSACFVLPIKDSLEEIYESLKNAAITHKFCGGTGFSFSQVRPKGDNVGENRGVSAGPVLFMKVFNYAIDIIKQGGKRKGGNMGILSVDHPDILEFITCKEKDDQITNYNISVGITDEFMRAVYSEDSYDLFNPATKKIIGQLNAKRVFDLICTMAWKNGDPGVIFLDRMNWPESNPTPLLGKIESTDPCGEQPLLPYESCNLGSINLAEHVSPEKKVDWEKLRKTVRVAVNFLDNVIDANNFPLEKTKEITLGNRKIGLGVMGWADMLIKLRIPYNSEEAINLADKVMGFINQQAKISSHQLALDRGVFPNFSGSIYDTQKEEDRVRNATRTTIAPTGTISLIAGCSAGIEPLFAISYLRKTPQFELLEVNPLFEEVAREENFYTPELMKNIAQRGSIQDLDEVPENIKKIFVTAVDLSPEDHVRMQATFQKHTNNAVSKTVNFHHTATVEDVVKVYQLAYELGCKGITIYRDGSKDDQVLNIKREIKEPEENFDNFNQSKKDTSFLNDDKNELLWDNPFNNKNSQNYL